MPKRLGIFHLARRALGEVSEDEILSVKLELKECREIVEDSGLGTQGFQYLEEQRKRESTNAQRIIDQSKALEDYNRLKAELRESFDRHKVTALRKAANMISHYGEIQKDLGAFLCELQKQYRWEKIIHG